jgi:hypothetical protein
MNLDGENQDLAVHLSQVIDLAPNNDFMLRAIARHRT